jgi:hypothetical protein
MASRRGQQPAFWLSVAGIAALTPTLLNLAADRLGHLAPGLKTWNDYNTRRNG